MLFLIKIYQLLIPRPWRDCLRDLRKSVIQKLKYFYEIFLNFLYFPLAWCLKVFGCIFPSFQYLNRIGHLACEPDIFLKEAFLEGRSYSYPVILIRTKAANEFLLKEWEKYYVVIKNRVLVSLLGPLLRHPLTRFDTKKYIVAINKTAKAFRIQASWGSRPPLLKISKETNEAGLMVLKKLGVDTSRWYVCMHARSPHYSPGDEKYNSFRNFDFEDFNLAIKWVHDNGGVCIRMGDSQLEPIRGVDGVIDYATSDLKQDWIDIYLAASCRFFLGSASGLYSVASIYGRPVATVNMAPLSMTLPLGKGDIGIPKLYRNKISGQLIKFNEIIAKGAANYRFGDEFIAADIELENNSPEDILDLVIEQYNRTSGVYAGLEEDTSLQKTFLELLKDGDYCYQSAANIGSAFLRKYKDLLK